MTETLASRRSLVWLPRRTHAPTLAVAPRRTGVGSLVAIPEKPKLRPIEAFPAEHEGRRMILLRDPTGYSDNLVAVTEPGLFILALFDGRRTLRDVQEEILRQTGQLVDSGQIAALVEQVDRALLMEGETFEAHRAAVDGAFRAAPVRAPHHAGGAYEADPAALASQLDSMLDGHPTAPPGRRRGRLVGLVAPHIDYARGAEGYRAAYATLRDALSAGAADAPDLFVVFGTRHAPAPGLFNLTAKDYGTPLGAAPTAAAIVHRVADRVKSAGEDPFAGESAHRTEHSIEFQCVFLKHLMAARDFEVVPVLCGALENPMVSRRDPADDQDVARFIDALREEVERSGRRAIYLAGADLAHVGPHFGDPDPVTSATLASLDVRDRATMAHVAAGDARAFFEDVAADGDTRKICGIPPIWATLAALGNRVTGELLHYGQAPEPEFASVVTYASAALYEG